MYFDIILGIPSPECTEIGLRSDVLYRDLVEFDLRLPLLDLITGEDGLLDDIESLKDVFLP